MERIPLNQDITVKFDDHSFTIKDCIGQGNSSLVYKAEYIKAGVPVVLKEIYPVGLGISRNSDNSLSVLPKSKGAFDFYCKNSNDVFGNIGGFYNDPQTNNSTIFPFASGEANGTYYYASEWRAGDTLEKKLGEDKFSLADLIQVCKSIADTLQTYHDKKYIHTDIKPQNVFIRDNNTIMMFDFDSVFTKDQLRSGFISYSEDYAAPEVRYFPDEIDLNRTDIYSVGVILYKRLFGRLPEEYLYQPSFVPDYSKCEELQKYSPELKGILTKIFNGTLSLLIDDRYQTAKALAKDLGKAHKIAGKDRFILDMDLRSELSNAIKRDAELSDIHKALTEQGKKVAYICGTGGTGKTELALQYAEKYRPYYATIQKVTYRENFKTTISDIEISTGKADIDSICKILNNETLGNTLIIIDDYFKLSEGDKAEEDKAVFQNLLEASKRNVRFILTSRDNPDNINNYFHKISTDDIPDDLKREIKKMVFRIAGKKSLKYENEIRKFLKAIDYHFLTSSLFAELSGDILMTSPKKYPIFLKTLKEQGISSPEIQNRKGERFFEEIIKIFHEQKTFTKEEKIIMLNASLLPPFGMPEGEFLEYIKADITPTIGNSPVCDALVKSNWLRRETRNEYYISMHPIIREVCVSEFILEAQGSFKFALFIPLLQGLSSKLDLSAENIELPEVMKFGLLYAIPVRKKLSDLISRAKERNPETDVSEEIRRLMNDIEKKYNRIIFGIFRNKYGKALKFLSQNANFL